MVRDHDSSDPAAAAPVDAATSAWVQQLTGRAPVRLEHVQTLWRGYGAIVRVRFAGAASLVVKRVAPPRVVDGSAAARTAHARRLRSYAVERRFYADWCPAPAPAHRTARCLAAEPHDAGWRLLLEDLDASGFDRRHDELDDDRLAACLRWLASFHAHHLGRAPTGLWSAGTYWNLDMRRDELARTDDAELRAAAAPLDRALRACRHRTLVHGDAKPANFCFARDDVAAVDFQWAGGGCGIRDVAYLLTCCLGDAECAARADGWLDHYFAELRARLPRGVDQDAVVAEWRGLYPAAWADFQRFLAGWAPGQWPVTGYTRAMTRRALAGS